MNLKSATPRHIIIKMVTIKEKMLKVAKKKKITSYIQGKPHKVLVKISAEILQTRRKWHYIFKVLEGENFQPRILYPAML